MKNSGIHTFPFLGQTLHLHPFRAIYWEEEEALLLADLHLGKARHFRQAGIPVPQGVSDANWDRLSSLLIDFSPRRALFLGDLFHSHYNAEWPSFQALTALFGEVRFELVRGNHDRLDPRHYQAARLQVHEEPLGLGPFLLSHHPLEGTAGELYNLAGHLHPCVHLGGAGRQRLRLPCFYFGAGQGVLPAFGHFTGMGRIEIRASDQVFVIAEDKVLRV